MHDEKIQVITYAGYKGDERPKSFILNNQENEIAEILSMWIEENFALKHRKRFFKVRGSDGYEYQIYLDDKTGGWFLVKR